MKELQLDNSLKMIDFSWSIKIRHQHFVKYDIVCECNHRLEFRCREWQ